MRRLRGRTCRPVGPSRRVEGFSLTEVMVSLLILVVLMAIALPAMIGPTDTAADLEAKTALDMAVSAQRIIYRDGGGYTQLATRLRDHAPDIKFITGSALRQDWEDEEGPAVRVSVSVDRDDDVPVADKAVGMATLSRSGVCWMVRMQPTGAERGTTYAFLRRPRDSECNGATALAEIEPVVPTPEDPAPAGISWDSPLEIG